MCSCVINGNANTKHTFRIVSFVTAHIPNTHPYLYCFLSDLDIQYRAELDHDPEVDKVKVVTQCYSSIEASSNVADIYKMTDGETSSFWQSDGSARSHWIRQGPRFWGKHGLCFVDMRMINIKNET